MFVYGIINFKYLLISVEYTHCATTFGGNCTCL